MYTRAMVCVRAGEVWVGKQWRVGCMCMEVYMNAVGVITIIAGVRAAGPVCHLWAVIERGLHDLGTFGMLGKSIEFWTKH